MEFVVGRMEKREADEASRLSQMILGQLPFYNDRAIRGLTSEYSRKNLEALAESASYITLVARHNDKVIGFCFAKEDSDIVWLDWIGVDPSFARKGLATLMLNELATISKQRSLHKIWCDSIIGNEKSKMLLTQNGFTEIGRAPKHWFGLDFIFWHKFIH